VFARAPFLVGTAFCVAAIVFDHTARGESAADMVRSRLDWAAPADPCLEPTLLRAGVEKHLGRKAFVDGSDADVGLRITLAQTAADAIEIRVELLDGDTPIGERVLRGSRTDCVKLRETLVLVVAMLVELPREKLEERREEREAEQRSKPDQRPAKAKAPVPGVDWPDPAEPSAPVADSASRATSVGLDVIGSAIIDFGLLPNVALGASASGTLTPNGWPGVRVFVRALPQSSETVSDGEVTFRAVSAGGGLVFQLLRFGAGRVRGFAGGELSAISAAAEGFDTNRSGTRVAAGPAIGLALELELAPLLLASVGAGATAHLDRPAFQFESADGQQRVVHEPQVFDGTGGIGIVWVPR
jgi:hypothetical protein